MSDVPLDEIEIHGPDFTKDVKIDGPPGTGKTTSGAGRVARIVQNTEYTMEDVVWVTFRKTLAEDTLERFESWGIIDEEDMNNPSKGRTRYISTIHAAALRTLKENYDEKFNITSLQAKKDFVREEHGVDYYGDEYTNGAGETLFNLIQWCHNNDVEYADLPESKEREFNKKWSSSGSFIQIAEQWDSLKEDFGWYDFHDALEEAYKRDVYPGQGETPGIIVVDEYHDLTLLKHKLIKKWIDAADISIILGDPRQTINQFDGGSPEYYHSLDIQKVQLPKSYRVPESHWDVANKVLSRIRDPVDVEPSEKSGEVVEYNMETPLSKDDFYNEWQTPFQTDVSPSSITEDMLKKEGEVMHLARAGFYLKGIAKDLEDKGIPFTAPSIPERDDWYSDETRVHLHNMLTYLEGIYCDGDSVDWKSSAQEDDEILTFPVEEPLIPSSNFETILRNTPEKLLDEPPEQLANYVKNSGLFSLQEIMEYTTPRWANMMSDGPESVPELEIAHSLKGVLRQSLLNHTEPVNPNEIGVTLMTIHASKGVESSNVVVWDGITQRVQEQIRRDPESERNEWRTWFVALTRASKNLAIVRNGFEAAYSFLPRTATSSAQMGVMFA